MTEQVTPEEGTLEQVSPWEQLKRDRAAKQQRQADFAEVVRTTREVMAAEEAESTRPGFWKEAGRAVGGAGMDLITETTILAKELQNFLLPVEGLIAGSAYASQAEWGDKYDAFKTGMGEGNADVQESNDWLRQQADGLIADNETLAGGISRGLLQFIVPYVGWARVGGAATTFRAATARGFVIDAGLFDPNSGNLSKLINELSPEHQNVVTEFLATDPEDSEALNRLRMGLEGAALGTVLEGIFKVARLGAHEVKVRQARKRANESPDQMLTKDDILRLQKEGTLKQPEPEVKAEEAKADSGKADDAAGDSGKADDATDEPGKSRRTFSEEHLRETLKLSSAQRKAFNEALLEGDDKTASQILELSDFNSNTIDWDSVSDPAAIKRLINTVSEVMADHIDDVKGGVQTHEQTVRLGNLVGFSAEEAHGLFKDIRGDKGIAARFYAAKRTMMLAAREAERLIKDSKASPGDLAKKSAVMRHLQLYSALQAEVKGAQTEIARALNAMKILQDDAGQGFREFDEIMRSYGGKTSGAKAYEKFMDSLLDALESGDIDAFNRGTRMTTGERTKNIVVEYVINAMLSSPKTHAINIMSNMLNTGLYSLDRAMAGMYRKLRHGDHAAWQEARLDVIHKFASMGEAWKLAKQAWKEGAPVSDKRQRLEFRTRQAISRSGVARDPLASDANAANLGEKFWTPKTEAVRDGSGNVVAAVDYSFFDRSINTLGRFVRIPGRLLITGDEFFKTINRNAEVQVLAFRQADDEAVAQGLKWGTPEYEKAVTDRVKVLIDPTSKEGKDIRSAAIEKSRTVTFQESPTTDFGSTAEKFVNSNAFFKLWFAPFFRTPMNILRQATADRMPWGRWIGETRLAIKEGHPRARAEAEARTMTGMAAMTSAWLVMSDLDEDSPIEFVGRLAYDSVRREAGVKDYSIRIGSEWFQFNRLDPLGMWLGMMADVTQTVKQAQTEDESVAFALMQGAFGTTLSNVMNKTWFKSMSDLIEFMETSGKEGTSSETAQRAWGQMMGGQLGKLIPQIAKSLGKETEELFNEDGESYYRESWTAWDNLLGQLPWANATLPVRHDLLGRPRNNNVEALNPFAHSDATESPIEKELWRLNFRMQPMRRSYGEVGLPLSAEEYSDMTGRVNDPIFDGGKTLEEKLNEVVQSDEWADKTRERKIYEIKAYFEAARSYATDSMLLDEDFRARWAKAEEDDQNKLK